MEQPNLAARAGRWSATHRKTAIWGWLAFVVIGVILGNVVGQNQIHGADAFSGEAHEAEKALYDSGLRPNTENVLIQSKTLTVDDPEFRSAIEDSVNGLEGTADVENVKSPFGVAPRCRPTGSRPWSLSRSPAMTSKPGTGSILPRPWSRTYRLSTRIC